MCAFLLAIAIASQQKPMADLRRLHPIGETPEPPISAGPIPPPIVLNTQNGFVPYHLIPVQRPRFPAANAVIERARCLMESVQSHRPRWR